MARFQCLFLFAAACFLVATPVFAQGVVTPDTEPSSTDTGAKANSTVLNGSATVLDRSMSTNGQTTNPLGTPGSTASAGRFGNGAGPVAPALPPPAVSR